MSELYHHGIKGQKWGVRRYQNADGTLTEEGKKHYRDNDYVFEKGFKVNTVYGAKDYNDLTFKFTNGPRATYVYDPENKHDKSVYEGAFAKYNVVAKGANFVGTKRYEAVEDLKSPSDNKRVELFIESFRESPATFSKGLNVSADLTRRMKNNGYNLTESLETVSKSPRFNKKTSDEDLKKYGYAAFMSGSEIKNDKNITNAYNEYFKKIESKGYNAVIDDNNKDVYNDAVTPLIVLNSHKSLKRIDMDSNIGAKILDSLLTDKDVQDNYEELVKYNDKKYGKGNKRVAL